MMDNVLKHWGLIVAAAIIVVCVLLMLLPYANMIYSAIEDAINKFSDFVMGIEFAKFEHPKFE